MSKLTKIVMNKFGDFKIFCEFTVFVFVVLLLPEHGNTSFFLFFYSAVCSLCLEELFGSVKKHINF